MKYIYIYKINKQKKPEEKCMQIILYLNEEVLKSREELCKSEKCRVKNLMSNMNIVMSINPKRKVSWM